MQLTKHKGFTKDEQGTYFSYVCLSNKILNPETLEYDYDKLYYCVEFDNIKASTLKELKNKMSKI